MATPDAIEQLISDHQFIGLRSKQDENIHHLGFKVLRLAVRPGNRPP